MIIAGVGFRFTVTAVDSLGAPHTGYNGTIAFTSTDRNAVLPPPSALVNGTGIFSATLSTAGANSIIATDTITNGLIGQAGVVVSPPGIVLTLQAPRGGGAPSIGLFTGNGDGTFQQLVTLASDHPYALATADLNGDGNPDLVVSNNHNRTTTTNYGITTLLSNGNATLKHQTTFATAYNTLGLTVVLADVNGDGKPDLLTSYQVTYGGAGRVGALLGNGNGTFQTAHTFATDKQVKQIFTADVDGNGKQDMIVNAPNNAGKIGVLLGNGNGTFQAERFIDPVGGGTRAIAVGDINNDGIVDIVATNFSVLTDAGVFLGNGNGTYVAFNSLTSLLPNTFIDVKIADLTSSGKADVVLVDSTDNLVVVLLANGNGTFKAPTTFAAGSTPTQVVVADVNNDNKPDLALISLDQTIVNGLGTQPVSILLGNGNGTFQAQQTFTINSSTGQLKLTLAKGIAFTGTASGNYDIVLTDNTYKPALNVLLGNGNGTFQAQLRVPISDGLTTFPINGGNAYAIAAGDITGDGHLDLVVSTRGNSFAFDGQQAISVLLGNSTGTFQAPVTYPTSMNVQVVGIALGDLNGDSKQDIAIANYDRNTVGVRLGNGDGTFQAETTFAVYNTPNRVAIADINGDGKPDLIVNNRGDGTVSLLLGNGNGTFQAQSVLFNVTNFYNSSYDMAAIDLTGDGKIDIAVSSIETPGFVKILLGNGNGTFQRNGTFATGTSPNSLAVADVNGDGKPDIIAANYRNTYPNPGSVSVLTGNGNGTFQAQHTFATGKYGNIVRAADLNGDGKIDLAVATNYDYYMSVLLGNGNGTFQAQATFATGAVANAMVVVTGVAAIGPPQTQIFKFSGTWTAPAGIISPITVECWAAGGGGGGPDAATQTQVYSTAGDYVFNVPAGVTSVIIEEWGAGGGAGGTDAISNGGGGGGGGAYARINSYPVTPLVGTVAVHVGAGGTGGDQTGTDGTDGGASGVDGNNFAGGGTHGVGGAGSAQGGAGGIASGGDTTVNGGNGGDSSGGAGGGGGGCAGTNGSLVNAGIGANGGGDGGAGSNTGAGGGNGAGPGGGGGGDGTSSSTSAGNGADGQVKITWTPPEQVGSGGGGGAYQLGTADVIAGHTYNVTAGKGGLGGVNHTRGGDGGDSLFHGETLTVTAQHGNGGPSGGSGFGNGGIGTHNGGNGHPSGGGGGGADSGGNGSNGAGNNGGSGGGPRGGTGGNSNSPGRHGIGSSNLGFTSGGGGGGGDPGSTGGQGGNGQVKLTWHIG